MGIENKKSILRALIIMGCLLIQLILTNNVRAANATSLSYYSMNLSLKPLNTPYFWSGTPYAVGDTIRFCGSAQSQVNVTFQYDNKNYSLSLPNTTQEVCVPVVLTKLPAVFSASYSWVGLAISGSGTLRLESSSVNDGVCGISSGQSFASMPTTGLCDFGEDDGVSGSGPWYWTCYGSGSGAMDADCSASKISVLDNAQFVQYNNLPATVSPGQTFTASIVMKNSGDTTWTAGANYKLGSQSPQDNSIWGINRISLASDVAPNANGIFTAVFTSPSIPGIYNFQWQMMIEGTKWFGSPSTNQQIQVMAPAAVCGDSVVNGAEQCDLGVGNGACPSTCSAGCALNACSPPVVCGDGVVNGSEECDNGVGGNGGCPNTCSNSCTSNTCNTINIGTFKEVAP